MTAQHPNAEEGGGDGNHAVGYIADQGSLGGEASFRENLGAVVHDGIDAGNLLADGNAHGNEDNLADPGSGKVRVGGLFQVLFRGQVVLDFIELSHSLLFVTDFLQHIHSIANASLEHQPAGAFRHHQHAEPKDDGRQGGDSQHIAPDVGSGAKDHAHDGVQHKGAELAGDDHQLVLGHHAAPSVRGGHFCQIGRHRDGGAAYCQAQHETAANQHFCCGREGAAEGRAEEDEGKIQKHPAASVIICDAPAHEGTDGGAEEKAAGYQALHEWGEVQLIRAGHEGQGTVHYAGVIAEEQSAEGGDDSNSLQVLVW